MSLEELQALSVGELIKLMEEEEVLCYGDNWYLSIMSLSAGEQAERWKQKDSGNKAKQHVLKILINGGYGVFGNKEHSFYDPRVAELVTAAGRYILSEMQHKEEGL